MRWNVPSDCCVRKHSPVSAGSLPCMGVTMDTRVLNQEWIMNEGMQMLRMKTTRRVKVITQKYRNEYPCIRMSKNWVILSKSSVWTVKRTVCQWRGQWNSGSEQPPRVLFKLFVGGWATSCGLAANTDNSDTVSSRLLTYLLICL